MIAWLQFVNANHNQPKGGEQKKKQQSENWQVPDGGKQMEQSEIRKKIK